MPITFVPLPGKVVQRKTNGTFDSFHQSDVSNCMVMRDFECSPHDHPNRRKSSNNTSNSYHDNTNSSSFDSTESQSRSLIRKKLQMRGGIVSYDHLKVASTKLVNRFSDKTKDARPMSEIMTKRAISADTLCGRSASRAMNSIKAETEAMTFPATPPSSTGNKNLLPVAPWLEEPPSKPVHRRNMNSRGAGHVRTMLPSNQLKPGRGVPVSECSFDWTTTASAMETNGTVMDPKHYKATNYSNDNVTGNSINTEILTKQLPLAVTERSNAVTMELIKAHNKSRVPLTATNNYTPHVIVPGIKTQNPFGAPQKPVQIGFLHKPPQQVNQASTNPRPSTTHGSGRRRRNGSDLNNEEKNGSTPSTQRSHSFCASSRPQTTTGIPRFKLTDKLYPTNTKERIFDPKEPTAAELQLTKTLNAVSASPDASVAPPNEVEHAANQWGELTSVVDMYMHPSNNVNRKYPTPDWVPGEMKSRNAFKLRV